MSIMYTTEEFKTLINEAPPYNIINSIYSVLVNSQDIYNISTEVEAHLTKLYPRLSELLFDAPLENMPRYLNHEIDMIRVIAMWRLKIAK